MSYTSVTTLLALVYGLVVGSQAQTYSLLSSSSLPCWELLMMVVVIHPVRCDCSRSA
jgi:hypothetical protein